MIYATHTNKIINLAKFNADMVCLEDIAHHLTKTCRFGGSLPYDVHYSVAQHCIELTKYMQSMGASLNILQFALLHDASETYLGDIVGPLKQLLPDYKVLEQRVADVIYIKYLGHIPSSREEAEIKSIDKRIVVNEAMDLGLYTKLFKERPLPKLKIIPRPQVEVEKEFLRLCGQLWIHEHFHSEPLVDMLRRDYLLERI